MCFFFSLLGNKRKLVVFLRKFQDALSCLLLSPHLSIKSLHYLKKNPPTFRETFKHACKIWCSHTDEENTKSSVTQTQITNVAIRIKYTICGTVFMSSARNKTWPRAAVCTFLISHLHLYNC